MLFMVNFLCLLQIKQGKTSNRRQAAEGAKDNTADGRHAPEKESFTSFMRFLPTVRSE